LLSSIKIWAHHHIAHIQLRTSLAKLAEAKHLHTEIDQLKMLDRFPSTVISNVLAFVPQTDVVSLASCCQKLYDASVEKLYKRICIRQDPVYQTDTWYIHCSWTTVSGYRSLHKREDQNDYIIYLKLDNLIQSLQKHKYASMVKEVVILDKVFNYDENVEYLNQLINTLKKNATNIEVLEVPDLLSGAPLIPSLIKTATDDIEKVKDFDQLTSLTIKLHSNSEEIIPKTLPSLENIEELVLVDEESASLRILKILSEAGLPKLKVKRLIFNHVHGLHDYNTILRSLTIKFIENCVDLNELKELEMAIGCEEKGCLCLDTFLDDLAPKLKNVKRLSVQEKTFHRDHYLSEKWDVNINRFLLNIPSGLKFLSIRHNPPRDGKLENNVEGNYIRRRKLYEKVIPTLTSLETLVCPTFLQTCSCYEILVSDLLWNGCECKYCTEVLDLFDAYLMNHQYYDEEDADFRDMIAPRLFGIAGVELMKRLPNKSDLDTLKFGPGETSWDFHGYESINHFNDYDCMFDESFFGPLAVCVSHFYKGYLEFFVQNLPNLKTVVLSGIFFTIDSSKNIKCIYDNPKPI